MNAVDRGILNPDELARSARARTAARCPSLVDYWHVGVALGLVDPDVQEARVCRRIDSTMRSRGLDTWGMARMLEADR